MSFNTTNAFSTSYFLRYTVLSYLYFLVIINENNIVRLRKVIRWIIILVIIQIPAAIIKYLIMGISEKGAIGTLSEGAGSVSAIFPLLVIAIVLPYYLKSKKSILLLLILGFFLFAVIGEKRAIAFFTPFVFLLGYIFYSLVNNKKLRFLFSGKLYLIIILSVFAFVLGAKIIPSLNPERKVWGTFDYKYVLDYTEDYRSSEEESFSQMRREAAVKYFSSLILHSEFLRFSFGDGPGKLIQSRYKDDSGNLMTYYYGVRYGGRMGFVWLLLQVGYLGTFVFLWFFLDSFLLVKKNITKHPLYLSYLLLVVVFFLDTFVYSISFIIFEYTKGILFLAFALLYKDIKSKGTFLKKLELNKSNSTLF
jgi:hypothetical protein